MDLRRTKPGLRCLRLSAVGLAGIFGAPAIADGCPPPATGTRRAVAEIMDDATLRLADAQEVRLMGLLLPSARDVAGAPLSEWSAEREARTALSAAAAGAAVALSEPSARDRWGRLAAHVMVERQGESRWLQSALVQDGQARVAPLPGETQCIPTLLTQEAVARATRKGLWANPAYAVRKAADTRDLWRVLGTFQIVEGRVMDVGQTRTRVFLNFGNDWRRDFTAALDRPRGTPRETFAQRLTALKGRHIRVRGWLVARNGPYMDLTSAEAIEVLPDGLAAGGEP